MLANEPAVAEVLHGAGRSPVGLRHGLDQREPSTKLCANSGSVIVAYAQAATAFRTVRREGTDDQRPAAFHGFPHACDVPGPIPGFGQEVKDGAVVPDVHGEGRPRPRDVRLDPSDPVSLYGQSRPSSREGGCGNVQHRHAAQAAGDQASHEAGISAPDVDHSGRGCQAGSLQQLKGSCRLRLEPAQFLRGSCGVDTLPVCFEIHGDIVSAIPETCTGPNQARGRRSSHCPDSFSRSTAMPLSSTGSFPPDQRPAAT